MTKQVNKYVTSAASFGVFTDPSHPIKAVQPAQQLVVPSDTQTVGIGTNQLYYRNALYLNVKRSV